MIIFSGDEVEPCREPPSPAPLGQRVKHTLWMAPGPETREVHPEGAHLHVRLNADTLRN